MRKKTKILPYILLGIVTIGILNQRKKHKKCHVVETCNRQNQSCSV